MTNEFAHRISGRLSDCQADNSFRLTAEARALKASGADIAWMMLGEPDFDTPWNIIDRAKLAMDDGWTHYTHSAGIDSLRERYAEYVNREYGVRRIKKENIVIQPGGSMISYLACVTLIDPGDEAIIFDPTFPVYEQGIRMMGGVPVHVPLDEKIAWRFDYDRLEKAVTDKTKAIFINSPQNPTGGVFTKEDIAFVAELARMHGIYVFSDEIYNRFVYEGQHASILHVPDFLEQTILLDGHSKTYAMTGWRLAFSVSSVEVAERFADLMTLINCNTAPFTQWAGDEALHGDQSESEKMIAEFELRRNHIYSGLKKIDGISLVKPAGAFYAFVNVEKFTTGSNRTARELQRILLHDYHVAVLPGPIFGRYCENYIRLSFAADREMITKGVERLSEAFSELC